MQTYINSRINLVIYKTTRHVRERRENNLRRTSGGRSDEDGRTGGGRDENGGEGTACGVRDSEMIRGTEEEEEWRIDEKK